MSVIVVNFNRAGDLKLFDPSTGKMKEGAERTWKDVDGRFCEQDGSLVCLFKSHGRLQLFLDGITLMVDEVLTTTLDANVCERRFRVFRSGKAIYDKTYPRKSDTDGNPFWPSDAEDEDVFLWIHNIVCSTERQQILLTHARQN